MFFCPPFFYPRPALNFPPHLAREISSVPICCSYDPSNNDHQSVSLRDFRPRLLIFSENKTWAQYPGIE